jgi:hypothetical protein
MTLPQIAPDRSGLGWRKKPLGNLSKVIVRIIVNAGKVKTEAISAAWGKSIPINIASKKSM